MVMATMVMMVVKEELLQKQSRGQQVTAAVACFSPRRELSVSPYPALIRRLHQPERQAGRQVGDRHTTT